MRFHIHQLKGKLREEKKASSWRDIAEATGINKDTLQRMANNQQEQGYWMYIDILCEFFGVPVSELVTVDPVQLPHSEPFRRKKTKE